MFGLGKKERVKFDSIECGQLIKYVGKYGNTKLTLVFEFGHIDDAGTVWWQNKLVVLDKDVSWRDHVCGTAKIECDGRVYEQKQLNVRGGKFWTVTDTEALRYDDAVDMYYMKKFDDGRIVIADMPSHKRADGKIAMTDLMKTTASKFMYAKTKDTHAYIFEFSDLRYFCHNDDVIIYSKGLRLYDGMMNKLEENINPVACYFNIDVLREATAEEEYELKTERGKLALLKEQKKSDALSVKDLKRDDLVVLQDDDYKQIIEFKCVSDGAIGFQRKILEILDEHDYNIEHNDRFATIYPQHYKTFRRATDDEKKMFDDFMTRYSNMGSCIRKSYADELIEKRQKESDALRDKIQSFRPFKTKVLVSNGKNDVWRPAIFGCIADDHNKFMIVGGQEYKYCVAFNTHRELLGKKFADVHIE